LHGSLAEEGKNAYGRGKKTENLIQWIGQENIKESSQLAVK
jgi:hypothetical protein